MGMITLYSSKEVFAKPYHFFLVFSKKVFNKGLLKVCRFDSTAFGRNAQYTVWLSVSELHVLSVTKHVVQG